jgi:hypothetical protein
MEDADNTTPDEFNDKHLAIRFSGHEPLISAQAAVVLLRLVRNVQRNCTDTLDQQEKT